MIPKPNAALKKAALLYQNRIWIAGPVTRKEKPVADIFDSTRRKIAKHISKEIAPSVFAEKEGEFKAKVREITDLALVDPKLRKRVEGYIHYTAMDHIQKYFRSREFKKKCMEVAKGMIK